DLVQLLLKKGANITLKNKYGDTPLIIAATNDINIVNMLITYGANISDTNYHKETVLYIAHSHNIIKNIDQLNYCQYDHVDNYIGWCIGNGAEINTRNTNKLRPVDVAENLYNYALKHSINEEVTHKEKIYYLFLNHTPYCFDAIVYSLLRRTVDNYDVIKIIMGYYKALTIDREIAMNINRDADFYDYSMQKIKKEQFRNDLLKQICEKSGYYNPHKALPIM
ncbi:MAG TPA: ankyrin repeat domain-containing protein, partial [Candidatus Babeliales bacterium]|nr:ankyrin repeat domain-containing protein [Candidatus Babeliales bacterium]